MSINLGNVTGFPDFGPPANSTRLGLAGAFGAFTQWWLIASTLGFVIAVPVRLLTRLRTPTVPRAVRNGRGEAAVGGRGLRGAARAPITKLPAELAGFRIAQLSNIHISPFMAARQIREFADVANSLRAGLSCSPATS